MNSSTRKGLMQSPLSSIYSKREEGIESIRVLELLVPPFVDHCHDEGSTDIVDRLVELPVVSL